MFDKEKLEAILEYLKSEFDVLEITHLGEDEHFGQKFSIYKSGRICILIFARKFIDDNDAESIYNTLKRESLKNSFDTDEKARTLTYYASGEEAVIGY